MRNKSRKEERNTIEEAEIEGEDVGDGKSKGRMWAMEKKNNQ